MNIWKQNTALALLFSLAAAPLAAQSNGIFDAEDATADQVEQLEDDIQDDFDDARNSRDFGRQDGRLGWYGSVAASANSVSGNSDTQNIGAGARFGYADLQNAHDFVLSYSYAEDDGEASANTFSAAYDYTRYFNGDFFGYGQIRTKYDEFGSFEQDTFVGVGLGYRVVDTARTTWSLRGGPGYRFAERSNGTDIEEAAFSVGSKLYQEISDTAFWSMDTDIITSDSDTLIRNDLGLNVSLNGPLALRTSLVTEYHTDPLPGEDDTDNVFGISLVYTFR